MVDCDKTIKMEIQLWEKDYCVLLMNYRRIMT
jgi:hypothetical protein